MEKGFKSPNRLWRESRSSLSFADWIEREKNKGAFLKNQKFQNFSSSESFDSSDQWIENTLESFKIDLGIEKPKGKTTTNNTFIGLNKGVLLLSVLIILGAVGYKIYQKNKSK